MKRGQKGLFWGAGKRKTVIFGEGGGKAAFWGEKRRNGGFGDSGECGGVKIAIFCSIPGNGHFWCVPKPPFFAPTLFTDTKSFFLGKTPFWGSKIALF